MEAGRAVWHVDTGYDNLKAPGRLSPEPTWRKLTWVEKALVGTTVPKGSRNPAASAGR